MDARVDARLVGGMLYATYKALHFIAGQSSFAVMRHMGNDMLDELDRNGVDFTEVEDFSVLEEKLQRVAVDAGLCESVQLHMSGRFITATVKQCVFRAQAEAYSSEGIAPFGCPFAGLVAALAERNLGYRARIHEIDPESCAKEGVGRIVIEVMKR